MSDLINRSDLLQMIEKDIEVTIDFLNDSDKYSTHNNFDVLYGQLKTLQGYREVIKHLPTVEAKPVEEIYKMSESDFITYTLSTICDYAKINDYDITDTVKVMGENLVALTYICTFDNWKAGADMRGGKNE